MTMQSWFIEMVGEIVCCMDRNYSVPNLHETLLNCSLTFVALRHESNNKLFVRQFTVFLENSDC